MSKRTRMFIVAGDTITDHKLDAFEELVEKYDISVGLIESEQTQSLNNTSLKLKLFQNIKDMPGYMRGLEDEIQQTDLVVAFGTAKLFSFQSVRSALKHQKPVMIFSELVQAFQYQGLNNIQAIQKDIIENASKLLTTTIEGRDALILEGANPEKVTLIARSINDIYFHFEQSLRDKFRNYIKISSDDIVILYRAPLEEENHPHEVINMLRALRITSPSLFGKTKVIFAANGTLADSLKYLASDCQVGGQVMFLHQDPAPFLRDLLCACDFLLSYGNAGKSPLLNHMVLEAAACGVIPLVTAHASAAKLLSPHVAQVSENHGQALAKTFAEIIENQNSEKLRQGLRTIIHERFSAEKIALQIDQEIQAVLSRHTLDITSSPFPHRDLLAKINDLQGLRKFDDALIAIEDGLLRFADQVKIKSDFLRVKGDVFFQVSSIEKAVSAYEESLAFNSDNWRSILGLGKISLISHSHEDALRFYKRVLAKAPNNSEAFLGIGSVYRRVKMPDEALSWLEKAVLADSTNHRAVNSLAQCGLESERPRFAIQIIGRVMDLVDNTTLTMTLGQLYLKIGKIEEGKLLVEKAIASTNQPKTATAN